MDAGRSFDESARGAELRLAELRRLLSGSIELTQEQESALAALTETLAGVERDALALRNAVLNAPEAPQSFVERVYERLPEGFDPSGWSTETYVTPVTAAWGKEFAEKPGGEITVDSLFEGADAPDEGVTE
jgi:hypothetical protein